MENSTEISANLEKYSWARKIMRGKNSKEISSTNLCWPLKHFVLYYVKEPQHVYPCYYYFFKFALVCKKAAFRQDRFGLQMHFSLFF